MKKTIVMVMAAMLSGMAAFAQKTLDEGFYRVQNNGSGRYLYVRDCTGDVSTLGADMGAIELWNGLENAISDPGSIIYLEKHGGAYDLTSQGTGVYQIMGMYMSIFYDGKFCQVYASGQYLYETGDDDFDPEKGIIGAVSNMPGRSQYKLWKTPLVDSNTDNYFGFTPTVSAAGKNYAPFYADFAYTPKNDVKTWYVSKIDKENAVAIVKEIKGTVARSQAVFIECPSTTPDGNKIDLTTAAGAAASGNLMKGTYFANGERNYKDHTGMSPAFVAFDKTTMRVLSTNAVGKLAFVDDEKALVDVYAKVNNKWQNVKSIPHNQSYLVVDSDCPTSLVVMTEAEYAAAFGGGGSGEEKKGDVNGDGKTTITDATCIVNFITGANTAGLDKEAADVNGDGKITITDATLIIKKIINNN